MTGVVVKLKRGIAMEIVILLLLWSVFAFATAFVAEKRGHSSGAWFAAGFFLGPFAFAFALIAPPEHEELVRRGLLNRSLRRCPECAEAIRVEARRCRYCAAESQSRSVGQ
jgi:hypothetical protein